MAEKIKCPTCGGTEFYITLYERVSRTLFADTGNDTISIEEEGRVANMSNFEISCNSNKGCAELSSDDQDEILKVIYNN